MIYIYDILLNFCDCEVVYDFYEWQPNDSIENIKRIKLIHVEREMFDHLLYYDGIIDRDFLLKIYRTCEVYTSKKVKIMDYCSLFSDGERALAIEFNQEGKPIYKSKLLIDEEEEIAVLASNLEFYTINYQIKDKVLENRFFTRNEILIRKYLMKEVEDSYRKKNYGKLRFLYEEYFDKQDTSYKQMEKDLLDSMKTTIDQKHIGIYQLLKLTNQKKQV